MEQIDKDTHLVVFHFGFAVYERRSWWAVEIQIVGESLINCTVRFKFAKYKIRLHPPELI